MHIYGRGSSKQTLQSHTRWLFYPRELKFYKSARTRIIDVNQLNQVNSLQPVGKSYHTPIHRQIYRPISLAPKLTTCQTYNTFLFKAIKVTGFYLFERNVSEFFLLWLLYIVPLLLILITVYSTFIGFNKYEAVFIMITCIPLHNSHYCILKLIGFQTSLSLLLFFKFCIATCYGYHKLNIGLRLPIWCSITVQPCHCI